MNLLVNIFLNLLKYINKLTPIITSNNLISRPIEKIGIQPNITIFVTKYFGLIDTYETLNRPLKNSSISFQFLQNWSFLQE